MQRQEKDELVKVSVLVITYQQEKTLPKALDSILTQLTSFPMEILVGDDGSTDETCKILQEYQKYHEGQIKTIFHPHNIGASKNLYELLIQAKGDYIAFLEGDDFWCDSRKLEKQVDFLDQRTEYVACTHACRIVNEEEKSQKTQHLDWLFEGEIFSISDFRGLVLPGHLSTLMCRRQAIEKIEDLTILFKADRMISDRTLTLLLAFQGTIFRLPETMSCYQSHLSEDGNHVTAVLYDQNPDWIKRDLQYTLCLESYAKKVLGIDAGFFFHKRDLFVSACWENLRHPGQKNRMLIQKLFQSEDEIWRFLVYLPVGIWKKLIRKIRRK